MAITRWQPHVNFYPPGSKERVRNLEIFFFEFQRIGAFSKNFAIVVEPQVLRLSGCGCEWLLLGGNRMSIFILLAQRKKGSKLRNFLFRIPADWCIFEKFCDCGRTTGPTAKRLRL